MQNLEIYREQLNRLKVDQEYITYFIGVALEYLRREPEIVKVLMEEVAAIAKEQGYAEAYAEARLYLGWYYHDKSEFRKAIECQLEAQAFFKQVDSSRGRCKCYNALVSNYMELGMVEIAIQDGLKGIALAQNNQGLEDLIFALMVNTSKAYLEFKEFDEVIDLLGRAEEIGCTLDLMDQFALKLMIAEAQLCAGYITEAYKNCEEIFPIVDEIGQSVILCEILALRGRIYHRMGSFEEARADFERALVEAKKYGQLITQAEIFQYYGELLDSEEKYNDAIGKFEQGIAIAKVIEGKLRLKKIYNELSKTYKKQGNFKKAYEMLEVHHEYEENIFSISSSVVFAQLRNVRMKHKADTYKILYERMSAISKVGKELTRQLNQQEILKIIYAEGKYLIQTDILGIGFYDEQKNALKFEMIMQGDFRGDFGSVAIDDTESLAAFCFKNQKEVFVNCVQEDYYKYSEDYKIRYCEGDTERNTIPQSVIFCPLTMEGHQIGVITAQSLHKHAYDEYDLMTLRIFASYMAIALYNAHLFEAVEHLANYDALTGILNRREILKRGGIHLTAMNEETNGMCIVMLDVDYFKKINDCYGHLVGDEVLKQIAQIIKNKLGLEDDIGRYGGEEFIIVLPNTSQTAGRRIAEQLRVMMEMHLFKVADELTLKITSSFGVYHFDGAQKEFYEGLRFADNALYIAKSMGRNKVYCHGE